MIVNTKELASVRSDHSDATIALRFGCYDLLHAGHQAGIDYATSGADILVLGVMPDCYASRVKGASRPIKSQFERINSIDSAEGVDYSFIAPAGYIAMASVFLKLRPDIYVEDVEHGEGRLKSAFLNSLGVEYVIDRSSRIGSTSQMIAVMGLAEATTHSGLDFTNSAVA